MYPLCMAPFVLFLPLLLTLFADEAFSRCTCGEPSSAFFSSMKVFSSRRSSFSSCCCSACLACQLLSSLSGCLWCELYFARCAGGIHYQGSLLRPWPQKMAVFRGQGWHLDPPFTCADKDLCRYFFHYSWKHFAFKTIILFMKKNNLSVWMKEICTLLVKLHIIFSRLQRVNQHARHSIIQVGCPTCCYQVCALDHANVGTADLD